MRAHLGLGSNLGDRAAALAGAIEALGPAGIRVLTCSGVYETDAVGPPQPAYLNQVVEVECDLHPRRLLEVCADVERALGRDRAREVRWGPRAIDIDILVAGDRVVADPDLVVPHPRLAERAFVLVPLAEIAPDVEIPGLGRARDLLATLGPVSGVRRL